MCGFQSKSRINFIDPFLTICQSIRKCFGIESAQMVEKVDVGSHGAIQKQNDLLPAFFGCVETLQPVNN